VATSHFITNPADALHRFSDAGMHRACFLRWEYREVFVKRFNDTAGRHVSGNGRVRHMESDGTIVERIQR